MAQADINGAQLAWQQLGDGPDLILVHGLAANRAFWFAAATALAPRFRVTLYDLRGHGYSSRAADGYSASAMAGDLLQLMDALDIDAAVLAGHSYGGAIALEAAAQAPQRCTRLALFDSRIQRLQPQMRMHDLPLSAYERAVADASTRAYGYDWDAETQVGFRFLEATARLRADALDADLRDSFTPFGEGRGAVRAARQWLRLLDETRARDEFAEPGAETEVLRRLTMPSLLMYAQGSRCLPSAAALKELLPAPRYQELAGAGHFFPVSHAATVAAVLQDFAGDAS
ncbi:alpha/beta hydrolase [Sinimarinibacterium sp. CAU 1509]|uniref:alpha/beta fold hydrolase n=1 Tax=Sinimarinibacterium sp. CAU 1509 TaxID=2562283 RepID=UPI0010AC9B28|nr:alpha/beta hydrolase [Sinimarinibacterium sp. CAU 1509]TJY56723.1 alpha/beta hydrolase [Sinimarinibacterium sp. CAU 1509]